ncbi:MAG: TA system antitoxin ParD family protein [bacterium]
MAERKPFLLRLDDKLYEELRRWAELEFRSVNGQIEYILRRAVDERKQGKPKKPA